MNVKSTAGPCRTLLSATRHCLLCLALLTGVFLSRAHAGPALNVSDPTGFFTNVATALLREELHLELTNLQVFPVNNYTPAVHRLLQVSANLYEATTNRTYSTSTFEPYCPTLYRPLFRKMADNTVIIAGFREVLGTNLVSSLGPAILELDVDTNQLALLPAWGTPAGTDQQEPLLAGLPLIIGARKGFPNFNEFSKQTCITVSRLLEFRRTSIQGPVVQTNTMFTVGISNIYGAEFWNSYSNPYPRNLLLRGSLSMTAVLADDAGNVLSSNNVPADITLGIGQTNWPGWHGLSDVAGSFVLPWGATNSFFFLTNSTYVAGPPALLQPLTHVFQARTSWYQPRWFLNLKIRALFALIDTDAQRVVDYVNLDLHEAPIDVFAALGSGADCSGNPGSLASISSQWCTNLPAGVPQGILNQIAVSLGLNGGILPTPGVFTLDPYAGLDPEPAIDGFRYNLMGWSPIFARDLGMLFYKSNVFYVPFDPVGSLYVHTTLSANDPLVHYTLGELSSLPSPTSAINLISHVPPLDNLGVLNGRFQPWGGSPLGGGSSAVAPWDLAAKDPLITRPDAWTFPTNQLLQEAWIGGVHRGTPWQTLFLKSANFLQSYGTVNGGLSAWQQWTGDSLVTSNWDGHSSLIPDALFTLPTNDWRIAELLASLFNTNDLRTLASANQTSAPAWEELLNGLTVLTNPAPGQTDSLVMLSNSPQAKLISTALLAARAKQPAQTFHDPSELLSAPELSVASPWLNNSNTPSDAAFEAIPSQLLSRLRPDSVGSVALTNGQLQIQFTGFDGYAYTVLASSNLVDWTILASNYYTSNGVFVLTLPSPSFAPQFYRSALMP